MTLSELHLLQKIVEEYPDACNHTLAAEIDHEERTNIMMNACKHVGAWEAPARMQAALMAKCDEIRFRRVTESANLRAVIEAEIARVICAEISGILKVDSEE